MKKRLIIDMDDVLADTGAKILRIFNERNHLNLTKEFFEGKDFYAYVRQSHFITYRDELFKPGFFTDLEVFPDSVEVVKALSEKYEVFIVSAATEFPNSLTEKVNWLFLHFPFISWQNMVFCGDKSIVHGDIMIDDHARNFEHFEGEKLLFHSMHNTLTEGYRRVNDWKEIYEILK
ncbi:5'-3'-deoxyribonucleotidase [Leadbetterella sp. DM7]|uniref:5' nucleotidase, NT5C type n=1 Tax=Leadbetterella sp. DM7 TaxID=3235085 RepID=UPI00349F0390